MQTLLIFLSRGGEKMNDCEAIILIKRYTLDCDSYLKLEYTALLNNFRLHNSTNPIDTLNLYRAKFDMKHSRNFQVTFTKYYTNCKYFV